MIYVGGVPYAPDSSQGMDALIALMKHPDLVSASNTFKSIPERKMSVHENRSSEVSRSCKWVYLFQREFATVDPALVDLVGTDEATTCVGVVIRNREKGMISVAHMDFPDVVDIGLCQMLSLLFDHDSDSLLDVHLVGGFDDISSQYSDHSTKSHTKLEGYSYPLCTKIIESLSNRNEKFDIRTLHVLGHNTRWDSEGIAYPIFRGFVVETNSGSIVPASFDRTSRCPDEIIRSIRVTAWFEDPNWTGRLLETYDTETDCFVIAPCAWTIWQSRFALTRRYLSDTEILLTCSSSPSAEGPDFVDDIKSMVTLLQVFDPKIGISVKMADLIHGWNNHRKWDYLIRHPDWRETFPSKQARVFQRNADGSWVKVQTVKKS